MFLSCAGNVDITVVKTGFVPVTTSVQVGAGATQEVIVEVQPQPNLEESVTVLPGVPIHFYRGATIAGTVAFPG